MCGIYSFYSLSPLDLKCCTTKTKSQNKCSCKGSTKAVVVLVPALALENIKEVVRAYTQVLDKWNLLSKRQWSIGAGNPTVQTLSAASIAVGWDCFYSPLTSPLPFSWLKRTIWLRPEFPCLCLQALCATPLSKQHAATRGGANLMPRQKFVELSHCWHQSL